MNINISYKRARTIKLYDHFLYYYYYYYYLTHRIVRLKMLKGKNCILGPHGALQMSFIIIIIIIN